MVAASGTKIRLIDAPLKTIGHSSDHWEMPRSALPKANLQMPVKMKPAQTRKRLSNLSVRMPIIGIKNSEPRPRGLTAIPAARAV